MLRAGLFAASLALAACYSPTLRDCTVTCASSDDCASSQVCGADKMCAAPGVAGTCSEHAIVDAGTGPQDAANSDAGMTDAPPSMVALHVLIDGKGTVFVDNYGPCSSQGAQHGDCLFNVAARVAQTIRVSLPPGDPFVEWTSDTCKGAGPVCSFTLSAPATITGKFAK